MNDTLSHVEWGTRTTPLINGRHETWDIPRSGKAVAQSVINDLQGDADVSAVLIRREVHNLPGGDTLITRWEPADGRPAVLDDVDVHPTHRNITRLPSVGDYPEAWQCTSCRQLVAARDFTLAPKTLAVIENEAVSSTFSGRRPCPGVADNVPE